MACIPERKDFRSTIGLSDWSIAADIRNRPIQRIKQYYSGVSAPAFAAYPKVSLIVCVYNGERTMDSCLASLQKLNYPNYEVVVINDGSTDSTREIAEVMIIFTY